MKLYLNLFAVLAFCLASTLNAQEIDLSKVKCAMTGKGPANAEKFVEFMGGKVFFCCGNCVAKFKEDMKLKDEAKHAALANHQLVLTKQYKQKACPMSGSPTSAKIATEVGGVGLTFCCGSCKALVDESESLSEKVSLVFSPEEFKNGFEKAAADDDEEGHDIEGLKCFIMPRKDVREKYAMEFNGGTLYLCCKSCTRRMERDPDKYAAQCNHQMVLTGQFEQTMCPLTGEEMSDKFVVEVDGVKVKFADEESKKAVEAKTDKKEQIGLVFSTKQFKKSYKAKKASGEDE
ncbi:MAG: hypothetical protein AAF623_14430 [Planctomycetota bacterium]